MRLSVGLLYLVCEAGVVLCSVYCIPFSSLRLAMANISEIDIGCDVEVWTKRELPTGQGSETVIDVIMYGTYSDLYVKSSRSP